MAFDFSFKYYLFCLQADFHLKSRSMWAACQHIIRPKRPILQRSSFTCPGSCHSQICSCSLAKRRVELMEYSTSTHSFIHSTSIYWVPTMCQALSWGVGNRYSSEWRQTRYLLSWSLHSNVHASLHFNSKEHHTIKINKSTRMKTDLFT